MGGMSHPRTIVVTGATRGLGRSLVPHFAAAGHTVVGCGRSESHVRELAAAFGPPHTFAAVDVRDCHALGAEDLVAQVTTNQQLPRWDSNTLKTCMFFGRNG